MLAALFPVLALVATTQTFAAPLEARQDAVASESFAGNNVTATATGSCGRHGRHRRPRPSASTSAVVESTVPFPSASASAAREVIGSVAPSPVATSIIGNNNNAIVTSSSAVASSSKAASSASPTSTQATSSAAPAPSPSTGTGSGDAFIDEMLKLHNDFRAQYGAGPLTWNADAAAFAQGHASKCVFEHSKDSGYGENLAAGVGGGYNAASGFNAWAGEASLYDYNNPGFSSATGHFTQVVWKGTTEVGCAFVECDSGTLFDASYNAPNKFLECNYKAPGNYQGQFPDNVGKKV